MTTLDKAKVLRWMKANKADHTDECGEVNYTALAEAAADHFDCNEVGGPLDDETHPIWDWATLA